MSDSSLRVSWPDPPLAPVSLRMPASKSELNRMLVLAALRAGPTRLQGTSQCDDVRHMVESLRSLRVSIEEDVSGYRIEGRGSAWWEDRESAEIDCGAGGTTLRFLMALAAGRPGCTKLKVDPQLKKRPAESWIQTLKSLGTQIEDVSDGFKIFGSTRWPDRVAVNVDQSSQFLSALTLVACVRSRPLTIECVGNRVSEPYAELTLDCVRRFGAHVTETVNGVTVHPSQLSDLASEAQFEIEGDASSAAIWLAAKALGWPVEVENFPSSSLQADACLPKILKTFQNESREISLKNSPDLAPVLALLSALLPGSTSIVGAEHLRHKESNRIEDLMRSLNALGIHISPRPDGFHVNGGQKPQSGSFQPFGDHRLAMAAALLASRCEYVVIENASVVNKSYPEFWNHAREVGWRVEA